MRSGIFEKALGLFRAMDALGLTIEEAVRHGNLDRLDTLRQEMEILQEAAAPAWESARAQLEEQGADEGHEAVRELLALMRVIHDRNRYLEPRLQGMMAMHRAEVEKLQSGNTILQGYRPILSKTGRLISSSN